MNPVSALLAAIAAYAVVGAIFGLAFVLVGARRIDAAADRAPLWVRILFWPGAMALWPLLAARWWNAGKSTP